MAAFLAVPAVAAAQTAGVHATRAGVSSAFVPGDLLVLCGGGVAAVVFGAVINRAVAVLSARSAAVSPQMLAGVVGDPDSLVVADSRTDVSPRTAAAA